MGKRREERQPIRLPATAWYMLEDGTLAVDHIRTVEISRMGARITGLKHPVHPGLMLSIQQGNSTGRFRIVWVGEEGSEREGQAGIECVEIGQAVNRVVLQIDDNAFDRERRHGALQRSGYDVISPPSAAEAFEVLETRLVDVVILGYPLAQYDFEAVLPYVRDRHPQTRIILATSAPGTVPEPVQERVDAVLHRGDNIYTLTGVLESLLGSSSQLKWPLTRVAHRYAISTAVHVRIVRSGAAVEAVGKSLDMSEEGICLALDTPLVPGELLSMRFSIPTLRDPLNVRGMVRHGNCTKFGIEFLPLTPEERDALRALCSVLPPASEPVWR